LTSEKYEAIVLGVAHNEFLKMNFGNLKKDTAIIYDVKGILNNCSDGRL
jgi:UDP-N-acetyl-D-galactosamine dehydrogenase